MLLQREEMDGDRVGTHARVRREQGASEKRAGGTRLACTHASTTRRVVAAKSDASRINYASDVMLYEVGIHADIDARRPSRQRGI